MSSVMIEETCDKVHQDCCILNRAKTVEIEGNIIFSNQQKRFIEEYKRIVCDTYFRVKLSHEKRRESRYEK